MDKLNNLSDKMNWPNFGQSNDVLGAGKQFVQTNTVIGKVAFLLLVVLIFIILLRIGLIVLSWAISPQGDVVILPGMMDAQEPIHISVNPNLKDSIPIKRSVDEDKGIEFTWSTWVYINQPHRNDGDVFHIFNKGSRERDDYGYATPNNAPGMYLEYSRSGVGDGSGDTKNGNYTLRVKMNTFTNPNETVEIPYFPTRKWVSIIMTCNGRVINVYINGNLTQRKELNGIPKQNYGDIYIASNGGFKGQISDLRYYDQELSNFMINYLVLMGPNKKVIGKMIADSGSSYMSSKWYFAGNGDAYNGSD